MLLRQDTLNVHIYVPYYSGQIPTSPNFTSTWRPPNNCAPTVLPVSYHLDAMLPRFHGRMSTAAEIDVWKSSDNRCVSVKKRVRWANCRGDSLLFFFPKLHVVYPATEDSSSQGITSGTIGRQLLLCWQGFFFFFQKLLTGMNNFSNPIWGGTGGRKE